jgi:lysophospholipase L1-like esterase
MAHPSHSRQLQLVRIACFGPLVLALALAAIAVARGELQAGALLALAAAAVLAWLLLGFLHRRGRPIAWFVSVGLLVLLVVVPETGLRAVGFRHQSGIEFGYPRPDVFVQYVRDPQLFWKFEPGKPGINSWGFRGPEVGPKAPNTARILFLGDSCTMAGEPPYPTHVQNELNETPGARRVESVNLSIAGYTSHQGRRVAEMYGDRVDADVVVVYYGWNDHWLAWGSMDAQKDMSASALASAWERLYRASRVLQWCCWVGGKVVGKSGPLDVPRVPVAEYRDNLRAIAQRFAARHPCIVLVTAPTSHRVLPVDPGLLELQFARTAEDVVERHTEYTDVVRAVARETGSLLLDLEREYDAMSADELRRLFIADGIHFTVEGQKDVARRIAAFLRASCGL